MEDYENRIINGILKTNLAFDGAEQVRAVLSSDIEVLCPPARAHSGDLWPCVWALGAVLSRQFFGEIFINCGLREALPAPAILGPRVRFVSSHQRRALQLGVGVASEISGDARGGALTWGRCLDGSLAAHPISAFALAGYLGFAALATTVGIPAFRPDLTSDQLQLLDVSRPFQRELEGVSFLGVGHLGQAYLALLYFLANKQIRPAPRLVLLDRDVFKEENRPTQILLDETIAVGKAKAPALARKFRSLGFRASGARVDVTWRWRRPRGTPKFAVLGFDTPEARQMALEAGYAWILEAGIGSSFERPRVSWHSLAPRREFRKIFHSIPTLPVNLPDGPFLQSLLATPGECGFYIFQGVTASVPSMGLVAAAYAWAELINPPFADAVNTEGAAYLWSPLLPPMHEPIRGSRQQGTREHVRTGTLLPQDQTHLAGECRQYD